MGTVRRDTPLRRATWMRRASLAVVVTAAAWLAPLAALAQAPSFDFYHGTDYETARRIAESRIVPYAHAPGNAASGASRGGEEGRWTAYTDFGKGFYTHVPGQYELARDWAIRTAQKLCRPGDRETWWGVVIFRVDPELLRPIDQGQPERALYFPGKRQPAWNAPWSRRNPGLRQTWLEFVEYNRHVGESGQPDIQRPGDYDWSQWYAWIQGPIWVPRDSGIDAGGPPLPEHGPAAELARAGAGRGAERPPHAPRRRPRHGPVPGLPARV